MSNDAARAYATAILVAALIVLCGAFWADCIFGPQTPLAAGFQAQMEPWASEAHLPGTDRQWSPLLWDGVAQFYPWRLLAARTMRGGRLALWNPHQMCGYPFVGNGQSALFYPPNWVLALVDVKWGMGLLAAVHYALAAVLTALLCRVLGLGHLPAAFGGIAFAFGGFMVSWTELPTLMNSAAWLPGALLGVALIFARSRWGVPLLAGSLAMTLLAGHFQIAAYVWMVAAAYALARVLWRAMRRRPTRLLALLSAVALGVLLGAVQVLPTLELAANSPRGHGGPSEAGWEFHERLAVRPAELIGLLDPNAFGNPAHGDHELTAYGIPYSEHCGFVGIITLLLGLAGVFFRRTRHYAFFAVLALLAVHVSMAGPLARVIYFHVPKLGQAGSFSRVLSVFTFAAAMAGAFGLEGICAHLRVRDGRCDQEGRCPWNLTPAACLCALALVILGWELLPWAHEFLPKTRREHVYPITPAIDRLIRAEGRVLAVTPRNAWGMAHVPAAVLPPNAATVYHYDSIAGYDSLMVTSYREFMARAEGTDPAPAANGNMLLPNEATGPGQMLMGLGTVLAAGRPEDRLDVQEVSLGSGHGRAAIYEVDPVLPRAFTADGTSEDIQEAAEAIRVAAWRRAGNGLMQVDLPQPSGGKMLYVTETFYPGWSAYVDGERREVRSVFGAFCGVNIQDSDEQVRLVFEPATVRVGCFLALVGIGLLAAVVAGGGRTGRDN